MTRRISRVLALVLAVAPLGALTGCAFRVAGSRDVSTELRADGIYADAEGAAMVDEGLLAPLVEDADPPVYLVIEGNLGTWTPAGRLRQIRADTAERGTYVGLFPDEGPNGELVAESDHLTPRQVATLTIETSGIQDPGDRAAEFIARADRLNGGRPSASAPSEATFWDRAWPPVMWVLIVLAGLFAGRYVMRVWERGGLRRLGWSLIRPREMPSPYGVMPPKALYPDLPPPAEPRAMDLSRVSTESWEESRRAELARDDIEQRITLFGEALAESPVDLTHGTLDDRVRAHARAALVCYEQAKRSLEMDGSPQLRNATASKWLTDGHHHLSAIDAIEAGEPPPAEPPDLRWEEPPTRGWPA